MIISRRFLVEQVEPQQPCSGKAQALQPVGYSHRHRARAFVADGASLYVDVGYVRRFDRTKFEIK